ncbi:hypothetical protein MCM1_0915 [Methanosarcina barkeri CM1]|uniref:Uncharacterized protein n=1 Tax=Methanosarcina barkeri CM1 TaxID=796385 RepID=A0A0G3C7K1_METBA|nr:hypothetical protein MCM1_0915 [Methanosarcina barkeri CM1]
MIAGVEITTFDHLSKPVRARTCRKMRGINAGTTGVYLNTGCLRTCEKWTGSTKTGRLSNTWSLISLLYSGDLILFKYERLSMNPKKMPQQKKNLRSAVFFRKSMFFLVAVLNK